MITTLPVLVALGMLSGAPAGGAPPQLPWHSLDLAASKFGLKATTSIVVEPLPKAAIRDLIEPKEGQGLFPRGNALLLTEQTTFGGRDSQTRIWFDGTRGTTQQREVLETGKRERRKVNRFTESGVFTLRVNPTKAESGRPAETWSDRSETFYPFSEMGEGAREQRIIEPGALIYLVAAGDLRRVGQREMLYAFSGKQVLPVEAQVVAETTVAADYELTTSTKSRRIVSKEHPALQISLRAGGGADSDMKILGLEGDVTLLVDPEHRLPLEVSGRVKYLGRVTIRLQAAVVD